MSSREARRLLPYGQILAAALLFSTGGAAIKASTLDGWQISTLRSGIAVPALLAMIPAARPRAGGGWTRRAWLGGLALAATFILYVHANRLTTAANAIFLQSTAPLWVALLGPALLGEALRRRDLVFMAALAAGGAAFFVGIQAPSATAPHPASGDLLAALSGLSWALTILALRWVQAADEPAGAVAVVAVSGNLLAFLVGLPLALPVVSATAADWLLVAFLGVFQVAVAYVLMTLAVRRLTALEISLFVLAEPVLNTLWAWWLHDERPAPWALAGGAVVLSSMAVRALSESRLRPWRPRAG